MKVYTYTISRNDDYDRDLNVVIPTSSVDNALFKKAKKSVEENAKHVAMNVYLNAVVDSGPGFNFSASVNRGLREQDADFYLNMNDDVILHSHALFNGINDFDQIENLGLLGAVLYYPDGKIQHAGIKMEKCSVFKKILDYPWFVAPRYSLKLFLLEEKIYHSMKVRYRICGQFMHRIDRFYGVIVGAFHMFSRDVYLKVGGYDENYKMGTEDIDFCLSVLKAGYLIRIDKDVTGIHYGNASGARYGEIEQKKKKLYYYSKWKPDEILKLVHKNGELII
ncbi:MAG: hypothetical protein GXO25_06085 [Euryarchaeota archaeon]|nr:hypothetical protein [Euryarchaeota archaeon]